MKAFLANERRLAIFSGFIGQDCADKTIILHAEAICKTAGPHKKRGVVAWEELACADCAFRTGLWFPLRSTWPICPVCPPVNFCAAPAAAPSLTRSGAEGGKLWKIPTLLSSCVSRTQFLHSFSNMWTHWQETRLGDTLHTGCCVVRFFF